LLLFTICLLLVFSLSFTITITIKITSTTLLPQGVPAGKGRPRNMGLANDTMKHGTGVWSG
jgi:hypothetical protein